MACVNTVLSQQQRALQYQLYLVVLSEGTVPLSGVCIALCTSAAHVINQQAPIMLPFLLHEYIWLEQLAGHN